MWHTNTVFAIFLIFSSILNVGATASDFGPLKGRSFGEGTKSVVVFLHGDVSRGGAANYHEALMESIKAS